MRILICLLGLGWVWPASARLDGAHCLRGHTHGGAQPHVCSGTPRRDHAGNGPAPPRTE